MVCVQSDWILIGDGDASVEMFVLLLVCWVLIGCLNGVAMGSFAGLVTHLPFRPYQVLANIAPQAAHPNFEWYRLMFRERDFQASLLLGYVR